MSVAPDIVAAIDPVLFRQGLNLAQKPTSAALEMLRAAGFAPRSAASSPVRSEDRDIASGDDLVPVRIYWPAGEAPGGVLVNIHGGGWVAGSIAGDDAHCRLLTAMAGCITISVGYRLAPEYPFPAAIDDCIAVIKWAHAHALSLGAARDIVAVRGASAGANIAVGAVLKMRDTGESGRPDFQLLLYPICDASLDLPSADINGTGYFLTTRDLFWYWDQYIGDGDRFHPYASPLRAKEFSNLPSTLVITAQYDPLRDEGEALADKFAAAGVDTVLLRYEGAIHGFVTLAPQSRLSDRALRDSSNALRKAFAE